MLPTKDSDRLNGYKKQNPYIYCLWLQETHIRPRDTDRLKVKGWKKILHANEKQIKLEWQFSYQTK